MSVVTLASVKTHLNITSTTQDGELQATLDSAEAAIARRVGPLEPTTVTTQVSGASFVLPVYPVLSLTSLTSAAGASVPTTGLTVDLASGVVTTPAGFGSGAYTVTYSAGRASCPADLQLAVKELTRHLWESQRAPARFPGSDEPIAPAGAGYLLPYRVQELLEPHMQFGFA